MSRPSLGLADLVPVRSWIRIHHPKLSIGRFAFARLVLKLEYCKHSSASERASAPHARELANSHNDNPQPRHTQICLNAPQAVQKTL